MTKNAIIMAAGKGTRMHSDLPKVLHKIMDEPMISLITSSLNKAGAERIVSIVGYGRDEVMKAMEGRCEFAVQDPQLGTGHAVMQAKQLEGEDGDTLVVNGDGPCISPATYKSLYDALKDADMAVLTSIPEDARAYGRVIRREDGSVSRIVEYKDASEAERAVREVNMGSYAFDNRKMFEALKELKNNNAQNEYYITDLVAIFNAKGWKVAAVVAEDTEEVQGVNDNVELAKATAYLRDRINLEWMKKGVTIMDPKTTYIGPDVEIGHDVMIYPNTYLLGHTKIKDGAVILPGTMVKDETIA
ncbi:MAG: NTP transferase domain-containing protein [Solobacterium sp.]|nr:NTP transferase domain-containing protein [Solobacterium sp.]